MEAHAGVLAALGTCAPRNVRSLPRNAYSSLLGLLTHPSAGGRLCSRSPRVHRYGVLSKPFHRLLFVDAVEVVWVAVLACALRRGR